MKKNFRAKSMLTCIAFAMMSLVCTSAKAEDYPAIEITERCTIEVDYNSSASNYSGEYCWYKYTATQDGMFTIYSSGDYDTFAILYEENVAKISDDEGGSGSNFRISYNVTQGKTYLVAVQTYYHNDAKFCVTFNTPCPHANIQFVAAKTVTCTENGNIAYYKCQDCGDCFSDEDASDKLDNVLIAKVHNYNADDLCTLCGKEKNSEDYLAFTAVGGDANLKLIPNARIIDVYTNPDGNWEIMLSFAPYQVDGFKLAYSFDKKNWTDVNVKFQILLTEGISDIWCDQNGWAHIVYTDKPCQYYYKDQDIATIPKGKTLYLKNTEPTSYFCYTEDDYWEFKVNEGQQVTLSGDVMTLLDETNNTDEVSDYKLAYLFHDLNYTSESVVKLSATETQNYCYYRMFKSSPVTAYIPSKYNNEEDLSDMFGSDIENVTFVSMSSLALNDATENIGSVLDTENNYSKITYTRNVKANWNTVCLPFNVRSTYYKKFYTIESLENGVITLQQVDELKAGTPALMYTTNTGDIELCGYGVPVADLDNASGTNRLVGTFAGTTVPGATDTDHLFYGLSANTGKYVKVTSDVALKPFRSYIECDKNAANEAGLRMNFNADETTAIEALDALNATDAQYFDINGRKQDGLRQGMNIIKNGEKNMKVVVR